MEAIEKGERLEEDFCTDLAQMDQPTDFHNVERKRMPWKIQHGPKADSPAFLLIFTFIHLTEHVSSFSRSSSPPVFAASAMIADYDSSSAG